MELVLIQDKFFFCPFNLALSVQISYNVRMKEERIEIRADEGFVEKVDYLQRINDYKNRSDTVRKVVEKEYRKEKETEDALLKGNGRTVII